MGAQVVHRQPAGRPAGHARARHRPGDPAATTARPHPAATVQRALAAGLDASPTVRSQARLRQALDTGRRAPAPPLQAKWIEADEGLLKWDAPLGGRQWFFDPLKQTLHYVGEDQKPSRAYTYEQWLQAWWPGLDEKSQKQAIEQGEARRLTPTEQALYTRNQLALKGRGYALETRKAVESSWQGSDKKRLEWDKTFGNSYAPFLTFDDLAPSEFSKEVASEAPFLGDTSYKMGWKAPSWKNDVLRQQGKPHGSYSGTFNLGQGELVASGSFRDRDELNQNEVIYQLWRAAHAANGLDFWDDKQFQPLKTIVRHNVVNETLRPILGQLGDATFTPKDHEFDLLLGTPNVRAVLFLVKDRGAELGLDGITSIRLEKGSAIVTLSQTKRVRPQEYQ